MVGIFLGRGLVAVIAWLNSPSEEDRIVAQLRSLARTVSFEPDAVPTEILVREERILAYLTEDAQD